MWVDGGFWESAASDARPTLPLDPDAFTNDRFVAQGFDVDISAKDLGSLLWVLGFH